MSGPWLKLSHAANEYSCFVRLGEACPALIGYHSFMDVTPTLITAVFTLFGTVVGVLGQQIPNLIEASRTVKESKRAAHHEVREALISRSGNLTKLCSQLVESNVQLPGLYDKLPKRAISEEELVYIESDLNELDGTINLLEEEKRRIRIEIHQEGVTLGAEHPRMNAPIVKLIKNADFLNLENGNMGNAEIVQAQANYEKALGDFTVALANEIERLP